MTAQFPLIQYKGLPETDLFHHILRAFVHPHPGFHDDLLPDDLLNTYQQKRQMSTEKTSCNQKNKREVITLCDRGKREEA